MSQNEQGVLYPFRLSGSRMRRSAAVLRRHGQVVDALTLVRRAAEQEDTPAAWLALAEELRLTCNWEAAAQILARVISREPEHSSAWLDMARCLRALGLTDAALNCAYNQLRLSMKSGDLDEARELIADMQKPEGEHTIHREQRLMSRALAAWQTGDRSLGERRIRRLLRISGDKERVLTNAAMLCMMQLDLDGAQKYLLRALRINPQSARILTSLSTLYVQKGKRRMALGFLQKASRYAETVTEEDSFLNAAWAQDAWGEMNNYLTTRRKRMPYRTRLQSAEAGMLMEIGMNQTAQERWRDIVAIDPEDRYAAAMLSNPLTEAEQFLHVPGILPRRIRRQQQETLRQAVTQGEELLQVGSGSRRLLDWFLSSIDREERQYAMQLLEGRRDERMAAFLRELLCRPFLQSETREWAMQQLTDMDCADRVPVMMGGYYGFIQCRKSEEQKPFRPWREFLSTLLSVTRRHRRSNEIVDFAASVWRRLPAPVQFRAGTRAYSWSVAVEVLFLLDRGEAKQAVQAISSSYLSTSRVSRVIRRIHRCMIQ